MCKRRLLYFLTFLVLWETCVSHAENDRPLLFGISPTWGAWAGYDESWYNPAMFDRILEAGGTCVRSGVWAGAQYGHPNIDMALDKGLRFVALVCGGAVPPPIEEADAFQELCTIFADHYRGRIQHYEFWNEPDYVGGWLPAPDPAAYAFWLEKCYRGVKAGNPDAKVSVGGLLIPDLNFLRSLYTLGAQSYFDAVALHPYYSDEGGFPVLNFDQIRDCRNIMVSHGNANKEIWLTEYAWNSRWIGDSDKAGRLRQALDTLTSDDYSYVTLATYHTISDFDITGNELYGLCDRHLNPREPYNTFRNYPKPTPEPESEENVLLLY